MPILCNYEQYYGLAYRSDPKGRGCSVYIGRNMRHPETFRMHRREWGRQFDSTDGIIFYPVIRYKGMRVYPIAWKADASEPVLQCYGAMTAQDEPPGAGPEFAEMLRREGWKDQGRLEPMIGYVHVDDLEKIEGPPPEGPF